MTTITLIMQHTLKYPLFFAYLVMAFLGARAELVIHYEFNEVTGSASGAVNSGSGTNIVALSDNYGAMNGSGQLIVSANAGRINTPMGADAFGGDIYYRIDFNEWDTSGVNITTKFGFRLKSVNAQTNSSMLIW